MPRVPPFDRPATYEDLEQLPPNKVAEIVDDELWASPRPAPRHSRAWARLTMRLEGGRWAIVATYAGDAVVRIEPFEDIEIEIGALWADDEDAAGDAAPAAEDR